MNLEEIGRGIAIINLFFVGLLIGVVYSFPDAIKRTVSLIIIILATIYFTIQYIQYKENKI